MSNLVKMLTLHEGYRRFPYRDTVGKLTVGIGINLDDTGLFLDEAQAVLQIRLAKVATELERKLPWIADLDEVRASVLVDMAYNLGVAGLLGFKNTLAFVQSGEYTKAAQNMLRSKWAGQVGKRATRLAEMMRTGRWPNELA
jgi:lysozyme